LENIPSKLLEDAVNEFSGLPGIGKKTALRLVLHLLKKDLNEVAQFSAAFVKMRSEIRYCRTCNNISESEICSICADPRRDNTILCIVEDIRDLLAIENTRQYKGKYHVLGGIISPMDGIGPNDLNIPNLEARIQEGTIQEILIALSTTMEGETTTFYLFKKLKNTSVKFSTIARGIAIGDALEYADEITLGRSIVNRIPYENSLIR
jgi:recombination protein RecR